MTDTIPAGPDQRSPVPQPANGQTYDRAVSLIDPTLERPSWTFLTNHAHVLIAISRDPELRQRDIAYVVGITPGAVQRILHDLEDGGYVRRERIGRRNRYEITADRPLRHPLESQHTVQELLASLEPIE